MRVFLTGHRLYRLFSGPGTDRGRPSRGWAQPLGCRCRGADARRGGGVSRRGGGSGPRADRGRACEEAADALVAKGGRVVVMRLSQVHDTRHQGRIAQHILLARQKGRVAYVGEGRNRLPAVHVTDAVRLYRLALERGRVGARYHAVGEEGVALRDIVEVIGTGLNMPVQSITPEEAPAYFGWLAELVQIDLAASSASTRQELGWSPTGPDLLGDLRGMDYGAV